MTRRNFTGRHWQPDRSHWKSSAAHFRPARWTPGHRWRFRPTLGGLVALGLAGAFVAWIFAGLVG